uniref:Uncharacterized protein n=1 Tax=Anopheles culicifacies TaxID=139723 RepID=A0A182ML69_9DIPT
MAIGKQDGRLVFLERGDVCFIRAMGKTLEHCNNMSLSADVMMMFQPLNGKGCSCILHGCKLAKRPKATAASDEMLGKLKMADKQKYSAQETIQSSYEIFSLRLRCSGM